MAESRLIPGSPQVLVAPEPGWAGEDTTLPGGTGSHSVGHSVLWGEAEAWLRYVPRAMGRGTGHVSPWELGIMM